MYERRVEDRLLQHLRRAEPGEVAHEAVQCTADLESPRLLRDLGIADDLDLVRVADAESLLVRCADVLDRHWIEPHQLRRDRVDRHLIARCEDDVLRRRIHDPRAGAVAGCRAIHHREDARMNLLLNREEIDERLVNVAVRVVAIRVEQAAERILHRARGRGVDMALRRRQVHDVLAVEVVGNLDAVRKDLIEDEHLRLRRVDLPLHVFVAKVELDGDLVVAKDRHVMVQVLALERVRDNGLVLHTDEILIAGLAQTDDGALKLPRRAVRRREWKVPRNVVFEDRRRGRIQVLLDVRQVHQPLVIGERRLRLRAQNRDLRSGGHVCPPDVRLGLSSAAISLILKRGSAMGRSLSFAALGSQTRSRASLVRYHQRRQDSISAHREPVEA